MLWMDGFGFSLAGWLLDFCSLLVSDTRFQITGPVSGVLAISLGVSTRSGVPALEVLGDSDGPF